MLGPGTTPLRLHPFLPGVGHNAGQLNFPLFLFTLVSLSPALPTPFPLEEPELRAWVRGGPGKSGDLALPISQAIGAAVCTFSPEWGWVLGLAPRWPYSLLNQGNLDIFLAGLWRKRVDTSTNPLENWRISAEHLKTCFVLCKQIWNESLLKQCDEIQDKILTLVSMKFSWSL